jgi:hypothetical protein
MAWEENNFYSVLAESFIAFSLRYAIPVTGCILGFFVGYKVFIKTDKKWIGWIIGILIGLIITIPFYHLSENIPGVGDRIKKSMKK